MDLPGTFPPTPFGDDESDVNAPAPQSDDHQNNKLHQADHPRGHTHTDSGVGMLDADAALPIGGNNAPMTSSSARKPAESMTAAPVALMAARQAALGSNNGSSRETSNTAVPVDSQRQPMATTSTGTTAPSTGPTNASTTAASALPAVGTAYDKHASDTQKQQSPSTPTNPSQGPSTPPYWGSLPTSTRGGIYNTVTGHGSPHDDHDQGHHMPRKSEDISGSERQQNVGPTAGAGALAGGALVASTADPGRTTGQRQFPLTQHHDEAGTQPDVARDRTAGNQESQQSSAAPSTALQDPPAAPSNTSQTTGPSSGAMSRDPAAVDNTATTSNSRRNEGLAAAGAAGAGIAATELAENQKHKHDEGRGVAQTSPSQRDSTEDKKHKHKDDRHVGYAGDEHDEERHKEKKGGILGIFHRHKDHKDDNATPTRTRSKLQKKTKSRDASRSREDSPTTSAFSAGSAAARTSDGGRASMDDREPESGSKAQRAGVAAGAGLGAAALAKHHHKLTEATSDSAPAPAPGTSGMPSDSKAFTAGDARRPGGSSTARDDATAQGPLSSAASDNLASSSSQPSGTEAEIAALSQSAGTSSGSGPAYNVLSSGTPSGVRVEDTPTSHSRQHSSIAGTAATGAAAATAATALAAKDHRSGASQEATSTRDNDTAGSGPYQTLSSGTASGARGNDNAIPTPNNANQSPQPHDHRMRDTVLGAAAGAGAASATKYHEADRAQRNADTRNSVSNQGMTSTTPSGARTNENTAPSTNTLDQTSQQTHDHRLRDTAAGAAASAGIASTMKHGDHDPTTRQAEDSGPYQTLSSGTPSGVRSNDNTIPSPSQLSQTTSQPPHEPRHQRHHENLRRDAAVAAAAASPGIVLSTAQRQEPSPRGVDHGAQTQTQTAPTNIGEPRRSSPTHASAQNPALAASQAAWSSNSQQEGPRAVTHQCQNCGATNDISHYFTKERFSSMGFE